ncbi:MAG: flavodoxin family protein [Deltaproteobacteria bacterium]|nr:flavodoxin family protein [Deltaproteobacteria bacterium]MBW2180096.1 flavodoxin family protein [Deltaproteobacteria bacterium]MBW2364820.1 flavodoxin family protein [Deltaproteobacteria bacterium]
MKVVGFNGSPRKEGNTSILIKTVFKELEQEGIETELVQLRGKKLAGCIACFKCFSNADKRCSVDDDGFNECLEKMIDADGIILGSPTYMSNITAESKALIDRAGLVSTANGQLFKHKVGAAVVAVRRAGCVFAYDALNHFFLYNQMFVPGSSYWNIAIGLAPGDVEKDDEGMNTMKNLGQNMAFLLKKLKG